MNEAPHLRILQKAIAEEVTTRVHSAEGFREWLLKHLVSYLGNQLLMI